MYVPLQGHCSHMAVAAAAPYFVVEEEDSP